MKRVQLPLAVLALLPAAKAGSAIVVNNCGSQVYLASVKNNNNAQMKPLAPGARYVEAFAMANNGVSIKISPSMGGQVTQFEFTLAANGQLFYDTSHIDGNPFGWDGTRLAPSVQQPAGFPTCVAVDCPPGQTCHAAYNAPNDVRTKVCPGTADLVFTLCTQGKAAGAPNQAAPAVPSNAGIQADSPYADHQWTPPPWDDSVAQVKEGDCGN